MCSGVKTKENKYENLDSDPPLELRACVAEVVYGFSLKHDSGTVRLWGGWYDGYLTNGWTLIGGPLIGLHYKGRS